METTQFLPRLGNDPQSGPILFTTDQNQNSNITFGIEAGLTNSVSIQNAGLTSLNGEYNYIDINDLKPYYAKGSEGYYYIIWINNRWDIYDFSQTSEAIYYSNENVPYPWLVLLWTSSDIQYNPTPNITKL